MVAFTLPILNEEECSLNTIVLEQTLCRDHSIISTELVSLVNDLSHTEECASVQCTLERSTERNTEFP